MVWLKTWKFIKSMSLYFVIVSAIYLAKNQVYHSRTKHIDVRFHFVREIIDEGDILLKKIGTAYNLADMMTKPIPLHKFKHCLILTSICSL